MIRKSLIAAAIGFAALTAYASPTAEGTTITWKPKLGASNKYKFKAASSIQGQDFTIAADTVETIKDIKSDGTVVIQDVQTNFVIMVGGQDMSSQAPMQSVTETVTEKPNGEVIDRKTDAPAGTNSARMFALNQFIYPDHPLAVGDTWTHSGKADPARERLTTRSRTRFRARKRWTALPLTRSTLSTRR